MPRWARALVAIIVGLAIASTALAQDDAGDLLRTLGEQLAAGRYAEALATARRCSEVVPGNLGVWYNLAGLEEHQGRRGAALAALRRAVIVGFDDFRFADQDQDLGRLREDPAYGELRDAWAAGLASRAQERQLETVADVWSPVFELVDRSAGLDPPTAGARLRVTRDHLELEILAELRPLSTRPPWSGGTGLLVTVLVPEDPDTGEGRLFVEFGVGMADGVPAGAVLAAGQWRRLSELTPKLRRDPDSGRLRVTFAIPWAVCGTLHPLVDPEIGVNLTWIRGGDGEGGRAAWLEDPAAGRADRPWRRGIPVRIRWTVDAGPAVCGRLVDHVVRQGTIELAPLAAVAGRAGDPVSADLVVRDRDGALRLRDTWTLTGDGAVRSRSARLAPELTAGSARLGVTVETATWETSLVVLPLGWEAATADRITAAPQRERPSLRYRLDAVTQALAARHPRQESAAIGATMDELEHLLADVASRGTSLPAGGPYLAVAPAAAGAVGGLCSLALPDGWRRGDPVRALLLLARAPGQEQQAVLLASRLLAERSAGGRAAEPLIVAVAHLGATHEPAEALHEADRLLDWLREFVAVDAVHVAGIDLLAATTLELAAARSDAVAGVLLITGLNFIPYPDLAPGTLPPDWKDLPTDLPVGWYWFPDEQRPGDQAAILQEALRRSGQSLEPSRPVAGGLDFSQAWSRAVIWASERGS